MSQCRGRCGPLGGVILAVVIGLAAAASAVAASPPNVVIIIADDLGYADVGFNGSPDIKTPRLDTLAREGMILGQAYVTAPECSPSRAGLMTGRYQQRFGYENNPPITLGPGLPAGEVTIADRFKAAGYVTGLIGKWHLGWAAAQHPNRRGFDDFYGFLGGISHYTPPIRVERNGTPVTERRYLTTAIGEEAAAFVARNAARPFFLVVSFSAPHVPIQPEQACLNAYAAIGDATRRAYAAMVCGLDKAVGLLAQALKRTNVDTNTLLFFLSDNGGEDKFGARNTPLRDDKASLYEGGIRVPFFVRWPGHLPAARTYAPMVMSFDILPTAAAASGVVELPRAGLDGVDLLPYLRGANRGSPHSALFWRIDGGTDMELTAARVGSLKLIDIRSVQGITAVYDIARDIGETNDIRTDADFRRLRRAYLNWERDMRPPAW